MFSISLCLVNRVLQRLPPHKMMFFHYSRVWRNLTGQKVIRWVGVTNLKCPRVVLCNLRVRTLWGHESGLGSRV